MLCPTLVCAALAQVELLASNVIALGPAFAKQGTRCVATKWASPQDIKQYQTSGVWKVSRGSFNVSTAHTNFAWLQVSLVREPRMSACLYAWGSCDGVLCSVVTIDHTACDGGAPVCGGTCSVSPALQSLSKWPRCCMAMYALCQVPNRPTHGCMLLTLRVRVQRGVGVNTSHHDFSQHLTPMTSVCVEPPHMLLSPSHTTRVLQANAAYRGSPPAAAALLGDHRCLCHSCLTI
jgi:hypothetical protein